MDKIKFTCPHCGIRLSVSAETAGRAANCPRCSNRIKIPMQSSTTIKSPTPSRKYKKCPYCGEQILNEAIKCRYCGEFLDSPSIAPQPQASTTTQPEETIWQGHPSILNYITLYILGILLLPIGIGLILIIYAILDQKNTVYTLTTRTVMSKRGIISRTTREVGTRDIRNINLKQGVIERLFGLGTVEISSAGSSGVEVIFKGIRHPQKIKNLIVDLKNKLAS